MAEPIGPVDDGEDEDVARDQYLQKHNYFISFFPTKFLFDLLDYKKRIKNEHKFKMSTIN